MSKLAELLRSRELVAATPAIPATPEPESSKSSSGSESGTHFEDTAPSERQQRIDDAGRLLSAGASCRAAYVAGDERHGVIPVTVVIRTAQGLITGEMEIPRDRWDPVLFLQFLREQDEREFA